MALAARRQRAVTSLGRKPNVEGPKKVTAAWSVTVMVVGDTGHHRLQSKYMLRGIVGAALCE